MTAAAEFVYVGDILKLDGELWAQVWRDPSRPGPDNTFLWFLFDESPLAVPQSDIARWEKNAEIRREKSGLTRDFVRITTAIDAMEEMTAVEEADDE